MPLPISTQGMRDLGAPEGFLTQRVGVCSDPWGRYHCLRGECAQPYNDEPLPGLVERKVSLVDLDNKKVCACLFEEAAALPFPWNILSILFESLSSGDNDGFYTTPSLLGQRYRFLRQSLEDLGDVVALVRTSDTSLLPLVENSIDMVQSTQTRTLQALKTMVTADEDRSEPRFAVAVEGALFRSTLTLPSLLAYGTEEEDAYRGTLPKSALRPAQATAKLLKFQQLSTFQYEKLTPADTPAVVEMALRLWEPAPGTKLHSLAAAFEAARRL